MIPQIISKISLAWHTLKQIERIKIITLKKASVIGMH